MDEEYDCIVLGTGLKVSTKPRAGEITSENSRGQFDDFRSSFTPIHFTEIKPS